ncbi:Metallo-dependent phosphatase-like protein [Naviculisporaceae sp. PSN 640]
MAPIRLLILSDTHDDAFPSWETLQAMILSSFEDKKIDMVLHCGDLTMIGGLSNYRRAIENMRSIPAEYRLVIPGNHDVSLDPDWWRENLIEDEDDPEEADKALKLFHDAWTKCDIGKEVVLLDEGIHTFKLNDGRSVTIYASPYTPEYGGYAFAYGPEEDRFSDGNKRVPDKEEIEVDIIMTHGPPTVPSRSNNDEKKKEERGTQEYKLDLGKEGEHIGCNKLFRAVERARPLVHCFGHIHEGYGAQVMDWETREVSVAVVSTSGPSGDNGAGGETEERDELPVVRTTTRDRGKRTTLVNAAIMRHGEEERNKPWIVELDI